MGPPHVQRRAGGRTHDPDAIHTPIIGDVQVAAQHQTHPMSNAQKKQAVPLVLWNLVAQPLQCADRSLASLDGGVYAGDVRGLWCGPSSCTVPPGY
jgi:hypothetical protein